MRSSPRFSEPSEAEIQHVAYHLWLQGGRAFGHELDHWTKAKELLRPGIRGSSPRPKRRRVKAIVAKPLARRSVKFSRLR